MRPIPEVADQPLRWTQPALLQRQYALCAGDEVVATLRWQQAFGSLALAESAGGVDLQAVRVPQRQGDRAAVRLNDWLFLGSDRGG